MFLARNHNICLSWTSLDDYGNSTSVSSEVTVVADHIQEANPEDPELVAPLQVGGWSRFEYWVVAAERGRPERD